MKWRARAGMVAYVQRIPEKVLPVLSLILHHWWTEKQCVSTVRKIVLLWRLPGTGLKDLQVPGESSKNHWVRTALPPRLKVMNKANNHACYVTYEESWADVIFRARWELTYACRTACLQIQSWPNRPLPDCQTQPHNPYSLALHHLSLLLTSNWRASIDSGWLGIEGRSTDREGEAQPTSPAFAPNLAHPPGPTIPFLKTSLT